MHVQLSSLLRRLQLPISYKAAGYAQAHDGAVDLPLPVLPPDAAYGHAIRALPEDRSALGVAHRVSLELGNAILARSEVAGANAIGFNAAGNGVRLALKKKKRKLAHF